MNRRRAFSRILAVATLLTFALSGPAYSDEVDDLIRQAGSKDYDTYYSAIETLAEKKDPRAVDGLIRILRDDPDDDKRQLAARFLGDVFYEDKTGRSRKKMGDPRAVKLLIKALKDDPYSTVRVWAVRSLGDFIKDPRGLDPIVGALNDEEPSVRGAAAETLGDLAGQGIKDPNIVKLLIRALGDSQWIVRSSAASALGMYKDPRAVDPLIRALKDKSDFVRRPATEALGKIGDKRAAEPLRALLKDPKEMVRKRAAAALKKLEVSEAAIKQGGLNARQILDSLTKELAGDTYLPRCFDKRKKIVKLVRTITPTPSIPKKAKRHMARGVAAFRIAKNMDDYEPAVEEFQKAANLAPWWPDPYYNLGLVLEKMREYDQAIRNLKFYLVAAPNAPAAAAAQEKIFEIEYLKERKKKAGVHISKGAEYHNAEQYVEAIVEYKKAIELDPGYALAHNNLGAAFLKLKRHKDAIPPLKEAIRLGYKEKFGFRDPPITYWRLALAYEGLESIDDAIATYEEWLSKHRYSEDFPTHTKVRASMHKNLGNLYERKGNYEKAVEHWKLAIERGHPDKNKIQGWIQRLGR